MEFWAASEVHRPAYERVSNIRRYFEPTLNELISKSSMASLEAKLRYVPIIMPVEMHDKYKERSKLVKKQKTYDCAPQLNYELFVNGSMIESINEYARGIETCITSLDGIGLSEAQTIELKELIKQTVEAVVIQVK